MRWSNRLERYVESFVGDDGDRSLIEYDQELHDDDHEPTTIPSQITKRVRTYAKSLPLCWDAELWTPTELEDFGNAVAELARNADEVCLLVDAALGRGIAPQRFLSEDDIHHAGPPLNSDRFLVGDDG